MTVPYSQQRKAPAIAGQPSSLTERYQAVRSLTESLCATLETEDYVVQTMPDVSPTKWHLAHVTWFYETFILSMFLLDYRPLHPEYANLFNSYYNSLGPQFDRPQRGLWSRPTVQDVYIYRRYVDDHMHALLDAAPSDEVTARMILGLAHEQQHQELLLMDIKHVLGNNPLRPALRENAAPQSQNPAPPLEWIPYRDGLRTIGTEDHRWMYGETAGRRFAYDNEGPQHDVYLNAFEIASRPVTNAEYRAFIADAGYGRSEIWLSDGWAACQRDGWTAPLYWEQRDGSWWHYTLSGMQPLDPHASVTHLSYYEANAYATWAGDRIPTEAEWEIAARDLPIEGNFAESGQFHPRIAPARTRPYPVQMYGDIWEWTASSYLPYPGYRAPEGAFGEYNGKFMSGQMVLRGGSCVTPMGHIRPTYRNFFPPGARWPFTGLRLAR